MPDDSLLNAQRELQSLSRRQRLKSGESFLPGAPAGRHLGLTLNIGVRVLDLVTGQEGVIVDATAEHIIISTT